MVLLKIIMAKLIKKLKDKIKKIKTFDWILIVFSILVISIFAYIFLRKTSEITVTVKVGEEEVYYSSWDTGPKNWFANLFYEGLTEKDGLGKTKAKVLDVFSYNKTPTKKNVYLKIELKTVYNRASNTYSYKGVAVLIGSRIKLNFDKIFVEGLITEIEDFPEKREKVKIIVEAQIIEENSTYLETSGTKGYMAENIEEGEEIKDNKGNTIIKIIDKRVEPAKRTVTTSSGNILLRQDPLRKDIYLTLEINALKYENQYFLLDDIPILVDQIIPISTSKIFFFPVVTKIIIPSSNE